MGYAGKVAIIDYAQQFSADIRMYTQFVSSGSSARYNRYRIRDLPFRNMYKCNRAMEVEMASSHCLGCSPKYIQVP